MAPPTSKVSIAKRKSTMTKTKPSPSARSYVVKLQGGDEYFLQMWRKLVDITMSQNQITYDRLNVTLTRDDVMGESLYNPMLPGIVADLKASGWRLRAKALPWSSLMSTKTRRANRWASSSRKRMAATSIPPPISPVRSIAMKRCTPTACSTTSTRQHQHLMQAWTIVRKAGYVPDSVPLEHHMFGMMLGKDGKPFKTRAGGTVKLADLLDEALSAPVARWPRRTRICRLTSWKIWRKWWVSARLNMPTCRKPHHRLRLRLG